MIKWILKTAAVAVLVFGAGAAHADSESDYKMYLAIGRTFDCSVENYGVLDSSDSQNPKARVYVETGGIGVIILTDLMVDDAGARYRFGSAIDVYDGVAEFEVNGSARETTGHLPSGASWPYLKGEFALTRGFPGSLHGVLKSSSGDSLSLYCTES